MNLKEYFESTKGTCVLSTADSDGNVNSALYSRPHVMDDKTIAYIMNDRRSHDNLKSNPHAAFLFKEIDAGHKGKRLQLKMIKDEKNSPLIDEMRRGHHGKKDEEQKDRFLVTFEITEERPLVGNGQ